MRSSTPFHPLRRVVAAAAFASRCAALLLVLSTACGQSDVAKPHAAPTTGGAPAAIAIATTGRPGEPNAGHLAFPDVARLADGRLLLVYRRGESHVDPSGRIVGQFGDAAGRNWSEPQVLIDTPDVDDRDPSLTVFGDGQILLTYFPYVRETYDHGTLSLHEVMAAMGDPRAQHFSAAVQISRGRMALAKATFRKDGRWYDEADRPVAVAACSSPARWFRVVAPDGAATAASDQLVLPTYGGFAPHREHFAEAARSEISLFYRVDTQIWEERVVRAGARPDLWLQEPALIQLVGYDGRLVLHVRTAREASPGSAGAMAQSISEDGGKTWSDWRLLDFIGHAPYLLQLDNGVLLSAFREVSAAMDHLWVSYVVSNDGGESWSDPVRIEDCGATECGYPSLQQLDNRQVLFVYYADDGHSIRAKLFDAAVFGTP